MLVKRASLIGAFACALALAGACANTSANPSGPGGGSGPGVDGGEELGFIDPVTGCLTFSNTFDAIQSLIFKRSGCTNDACHGEANTGGLDLRVGAAYDNLIEASSTGSSLTRVMQGSALDSFLFHKLAAATDPSQGQPIAGSPMPIGEPPLSLDQLEAIRLWIKAGAPERGSVGDEDFGSSDTLAALLGACLPEASPIAVTPLQPPAPDVGVQFEMPEFLLPKETELEVCFAVYYDFSDVVPARFQDGESFFVNGSQLRQDPQSHHLTIQHSGFGAEMVTHESFGDWTCKGGAQAGTICDPLDGASCGSGLCGSEVQNSLACIGFGPDGGLGFLGNASLGGIGSTQDVSPPRDGVFRKFPIRGILYWNSHAFNLTTADHQMHAWANVLFTDDLRFEQESAITLPSLYDAAGQPPYTVQTYCSNWIAPEGAQLIRLASHTHKRGKKFTIDLPDGTRIYESFTYADPLQLDFDPPISLSSSNPADRTFHYCGTFNNGVGDDGLPDPETVVRSSRMPARASCTPVACAEGKVGSPCRGSFDHATCDTAPGAGDGMCDACPITSGVTTEDEMFILTAEYYVDPASQLTLSSR